MFWHIFNQCLKIIKFCAFFITWTTQTGHWASKNSFFEVGKSKRRILNAVSHTYRRPSNGVDVWRDMSHCSMEIIRIIKGCGSLVLGDSWECVLSSTIALHLHFVHIPCLSPYHFRLEKGANKLSRSWVVRSSACLKSSFP